MVPRYTSNLHWRSQPLNKKTGGLTVRIAPIKKKMIEYDTVVRLNKKGVSIDEINST